jgi:hypothetical protein
VCALAAAEGAAVIPQTLQGPYFSTFIDFEHLEAKGIDVLRRIAARQRRRKKG